MDLVDVIWRGGFDAWTLQGEVRPGEKLPVQIPREQAETSDHFEIIEPKRGNGRPAPISGAVTETTTEATS
jgi:hypothetical protein